MPSGADTPSVSRSGAMSIQEPRLGRPRCERRPSRTKLSEETPHHLTNSCRRRSSDPNHKGATRMNVRPNILLVHGAGVDGSSWSGVVERLQADGFEVRAPQFPLSS